MENLNRKAAYISTCLVCFRYNLWGITGVCVSVRWSVFLFIYVLRLYRFHLLLRNYTFFIVIVAIFIDDFVYDHCCCGK